MLKNALREALAKKFSLNQLKVINDFGTSSKTKELAMAINNLAGGKTVLLAVNDKNKNIFRAAANLSKTKAMPAKNLNVYDILNHQYVLMDQKALQELKKLNND